MGDIERILGISRRMIRRRVECIKAMPFILHFGAVGDNKTDFAEGPNNIFRHERQRVQMAQRTAPARQREIGRFFGKGCSKLEFSGSRSSTSAMRMQDKRFSVAEERPKTKRATHLGPPVQRE